MKKARKLTNIRETSGKYMLDLSKLMFGAFVLGGIIQGGLPPFMLITGGFLVVVLFFILGLWLTYKETKNPQEGSNGIL